MHEIAEVFHCSRASRLCGGDVRLRAASRASGSWSLFTWR